MELSNCTFDSFAFAGNDSQNTSCILPPMSKAEILTTEVTLGLSAIKYVAAFSEAIIEVSNTPFSMYLGDFSGIIECGIVMTVSIAFLVAFSCVGYLAKKSEHVNRAMEHIFAWTMAWSFLLMPCMVLSAYGPLMTVISNFTMSLFGVLGFFRFIELLYGTGPKGFDTSLGRFVAYVASPAEIAFDEEGRIKEAPPGHRMECLGSILGHSMLMLLTNSLGRACEFRPWLPNGIEPCSLPYLGFPVALPALYLQTLWLYAQLTTSMQFFRLALALIGWEAHNPMRHPLLLSTSIRDFWGRRWNLLIHRLMHRSFFQPLAARIGPRAGATAAFFVSGLFHEYMWFITSWHEVDYIPGGPLMFFAVQFVLLTSETCLKRTWVGKMMSVLPAPLLTFLTTAAILPFGPLFLHDLQGVRRGALKLYPHALPRETPLLVEL